MCTCAPNVRPAGFTDALKAFPDLKICFAHFGHDKALRGPLDLEVLELARRYERVYTDTSLRLNEVYDGTWTPQDMVGTCLFLLSDDASWITGQIVNVDGGQVFR